MFEEVALQLQDSLQGSAWLQQLKFQKRQWGMIVCDVSDYIFKLEYFLVHFLWEVQEICRTAEQIWNSDRQTLPCSFPISPHCPGCSLILVLPWDHQWLKSIFFYLLQNGITVAASCKERRSNIVFWEETVLCLVTTALSTTGPFSRVCHGSEDITHWTRNNETLVRR